MAGYCSVDDILKRAGEGVLPKTKDAYDKTQVQSTRIETAIADAKDIIHQILPFLGKDGYSASKEELAVLKVISIDIAMYRMVDDVQGSKGAEKRYQSAITRLEEIGKRNQKGLGGMSMQWCERIDVSAAEKNVRFKKGRLL